MTGILEADEHAFGIEDIPHRISKPPGNLLLSENHIQNFRVFISRDAKYIL
jgi:hypothetical protein